MRLPGCLVFWLYEERAKGAQVWGESWDCREIAIPKPQMDRRWQGSERPINPFLSYHLIMLKVGGVVSIYEEDEPLSTMKVMEEATRRSK